MRPLIRCALVVWCLIAALAGCAGSRVVKSDRTRIGDVYTVDPQIEWSRFHQGTIEIWTVDGPSLQAIYFFKGIEKDEPLIATIGIGDGEKRPLLRPDMTPNDIMEFIIDSLARQGYMQIETQALRPARFGRLQGFRFDFTFLFRDGLEGQGLATGALYNEKLQLILYVGTHQHYYPKHLEDVERIIESITIN